MLTISWNDGDKSYAVNMTPPAEGIKPSEYFRRVVKQAYDSLWYEMTLQNPVADMPFKALTNKQG